MLRILSTSKDPCSARSIRPACSRRAIRKRASLVGATMSGCGAITTLNLPFRPVRSTTGRPKPPARDNCAASSCIVTLVPKRAVRVPPEVTSLKPQLSERARTRAGVLRSTAVRGASTSHVDSVVRNMAPVTPPGRALTRAYTRPSARSEDAFNRKRSSSKALVMARARRGVSGPFAVLALTSNRVAFTQPGTSPAISRSMTSNANSINSSAVAFETSRPDGCSLIGRAEPL